MSEHASGAGEETEEGALTLGIAPVLFSREVFQRGKIKPEAAGSIEELRKAAGGSRAFRFDARDRVIANVGLRPGIEPHGEIEKEAKVGDHLLLLGEALGELLSRWVAEDRIVLRRFKPLVCLGARDRLLREAVREAGLGEPPEGIDVVARWSFETRLVVPAGDGVRPWLGLVADVGTTHLIDLSVATLMARGFNPRDRYVGVRDHAEEDEPERRFQVLGKVAAIEKGVLIHRR